MADIVSEIFGLVGSAVDLTGDVLSFKASKDSNKTMLQSLMMEGQNQSNYFAGMIGLGDEQTENALDLQEASTRKWIVIITVVGVVVIMGIVAWGFFGNKT